MQTDNINPQIKPLDETILRQWPLPIVSSNGDKETRGHVLVIAGSREMPGAAILAATATLRAGAGKLTIATGASVARFVALAIPESRVIALSETESGGISSDAVHLLEDVINRVDAILLGPGMQDEVATGKFVLALLPKLRTTKVILDALAMTVVCKISQQAASHKHADMDRSFQAFSCPLLLTPHCGEMAHLCDIKKDVIQQEPSRFAYAAATRWNAVVVLKGATTLIAVADGDCWQHSDKNIGLAMSGSGDTLAGIIAGLAARGASLEQAAVWGVIIHAQAGKRLVKRMGSLGFLAREIVDEIPLVVSAIHSMQ